MKNVIKDILKSEAELVCSIPISKLGVKDKHIWDHTKSGTYSVKSAYFVEIHKRKKGNGRVIKEKL